MGKAKLAFDAKIRIVLLQKANAERHGKTGKYKCMIYQGGAYEGSRI